MFHHDGTDNTILCFFTYFEQVIELIEMGGIESHILRNHTNLKPDFKLNL